MVSVIIPTLNEEKTIAETLKTVLTQKGDYEVIVVDGGSTDKTERVVRQFQPVKFLKCQKGRACQMNYGAKWSEGDILFFLHADTLLTDNAIPAITEILEKEEITGGSFYLKFDKSTFLYTLYSNFSKINSPLFTYGDQGLFLRKAVFMKINGFKAIPIMEDLEIQERLRKEGRFFKIKQPVVTSARRFVKNGVIKQQLLNILLVLLFKMGVPTNTLKSFYYKV